METKPINALDKPIFVALIEVHVLVLVSTKTFQKIVCIIVLNMSKILFCRTWFDVNAAAGVVGCHVLDMKFELHHLKCRHLVEVDNWSQIHSHEVQSTLYIYCKSAYFEIALKIIIICIFDLI